MVILDPQQIEYIMGSTPLKINRCNIIMEVWFRSFSFLNWLICRFQPLIFQGVNHVSNHFDLPKSSCDLETVQIWKGKKPWHSFATTKMTKMTIAFSERLGDLGALRALYLHPTYWSHSCQAGARWKPNQRFRTVDGSEILHHLGCIKPCK